MFILILAIIVALVVIIPMVIEMVSTPLDGSKDYRATSTKF